MSGKHSRLKDAFVAYDGKPKRKSKRGWLILLFGFMIIAMVLIYYVFFFIGSIESAYNDAIYQPNLLQEHQAGDLASAEELNEFNMLLIALNHVEEDTNHVEEAMWGTLYKVNQETNSIQSIKFPLNLLLENNNEQVPINNYSTEGIQGLTNNLEEYLELEIDYVTNIRLQEFRRIVDTMTKHGEPIDENILLDDQEFDGDIIQALTGRQVERVLQPAGLERMDVTMSRQRLIVENVLNNILTMDNILILRDIIESAEFVIQSNAPFNHLTEFVRISPENRESYYFIQQVSYNIVTENEQNYYLVNKEQWDNFRELIE